MKKDQLITLAVVIGGILGLAIARKLGASEDLIQAGSAVVILVAASLKSLLVGDATTTKTITIEEKKDEP